MRLETKLGLFNGLSKLLLVLLGALLIPPIVQRVAVSHTDQRLLDKKAELLHLIARDGLDTFLRAEHDESYADYNILKQEYIAITPLPTPPGGATAPSERFFEEPRKVDKEIEDFRILSYVAPLGALNPASRAALHGAVPRLYRLEIG